ncbi:antitoxin [Spirochaetia bacterium]|nr:antitoxin [Spirochaetia bacterium]
MPTIRPVSDLRNNLAEISHYVHESSEPVFLTKDGYGDMVIMSMPAWEEKQFESEIYAKLLEAETEARLSSKRVSHEEVFSGLRLRIKDRLGNV